MAKKKYKVFVSHGTQDNWVARKMAKCIQEVGAATFLDQTNIPKGANFRQIIHKEIAACQELVALFTPWSAKRSWVWIEIGAAWGQEKPVLAVFYGMSVSDLEDSGQGKAILEDINVINLNDFQTYLSQLAARIKATRQ
jgi:hypothetical protein